MMKRQLAIVIPTWNNATQLSWCLHSLVKYVDFPYKIYIVNNGKPGEIKPSTLGGNDDIFTVLEPGKNLGWMGAHNYALERVTEKFYCMLNDDVVFLPQPAFFRTLVQDLENTRVGAVGPCSNFVAGHQALTALNTPLLFDTSLLIGFCMVLRTEVLREVGGWDAQLPGGDDLDLSIRLMDAGYLLRVDKSCYLHHFGQQTGSRIKGAAWDSSWSQEVTNNALIRKHGLKRWQKLMCLDWWECEEIVQASADFNERDWYKSVITEFDGASGLNIGCGDSVYSGVISVDQRAPGELGLGGQRLAGSAADIVADAADIPLEDNSQAFILAAHLLEHLLDPLEALSEWKRLLQPGGKLYLTLPDHDLMDTMAVDITHVHAYNPKSLTRLLLGLGFTILSLDSMPTGAMRCVSENCQQQEVLV